MLEFAAFPACVFVITNHDAIGHIARLLPGRKEDIRNVRWYLGRDAHDLLNLALPCPSFLLEFVTSEYSRRAFAFRTDYFSAISSKFFVRTVLYKIQDVVTF
jgi:hypothetical protein